MSKEKNKNLLVRILSNILVKNILIIIILMFCIVFIILKSIDYYTKHGESVSIPTVEGLQVAAAKKILTSAGLQSEIIDSIYQTHAIPGSVLQQIPTCDSNVKKGRTIYLIVQIKGEQTVDMPDLMNYSVRQAQTQLNSLGFNHIDITEQPSFYKGIVIKVLCNGDSIPAGHRVSLNAPLVLVVGSGKDSIQIKNTPIGI